MITIHFVLSASKLIMLSPVIIIHQYIRSPFQRPLALMPDNRSTRPGLFQRAIMHDNHPLGGRDIFKGWSNFSYNVHLKEFFLVPNRFDWNLEAGHRPFNNWPLCIQSDILTVPITNPVQWLVLYFFSGLDKWHTFSYFETYTFILLLMVTSNENATAKEKSKTSGMVCR